MKKVYGICIFLCFGAISAIQAETPDLIAEMALAMDVDTGEMLYVKGDLDRHMYPASLTKVMTALLLAETGQKDNIFRYSAAAKAIEPAKLNLEVGERLYARDAMDAILLYSANDIAYMIAENLGGNVPAFIQAMNRKARELGMGNTHFVTPSGLHADNHYSSLYDLSLLLRQMYGHTWLMESTCQLENTIVSLENNEYELKNRNKLILSQGCVGGKTGWTPEAGRCLGALFERSGRRIVGILLKSRYDKYDTVVFRDMEQLMDWAFSCPREQLYAAGGVVEQWQLTYKLIPFLGPQKSLLLSLEAREPVREYTCEPGLTKVVKGEKPSPWSLHRERSLARLVIKGREFEHSYALFPSLGAGELLKINWLFYAFCLSCLICLAALVTFLVLRHKEGNKK